MFMTLIVIGGVLAGLVGLLALILGLSTRPSSAPTAATGRAGWVADHGRPHPDAWSPPSATWEMPAAG